MWHRDNSPAIVAPGRHHGELLAAVVVFARPTLRQYRCNPHSRHAFTQLAETR